MLASDLDDSIREVWSHNLEKEFQVIRTLVAQYPCIAMDTEFPGFVVFPDEYTLDRYPFVKTNVDETGIIQLGLTFFDEKGNRAQPISTWQFNFKFDLDTEKHSPKSIDLLVRSGIKFDRFRSEGIGAKLFAELLMTSGLVLVQGVTWITFHGAYDFGYLLKVLTCLPLPCEAKEFYELLQIYFNQFYDIKYIAHKQNIFRGGLQKLADMFIIGRIGKQHQAGSDSRITGDVFFKLKTTHTYLDVALHQGILFDIGKYCYE